MFRTSDTDALLLDLSPRVAAPRAPESIEGLHCFVETDELRRLLCLMAGTELLSELCRCLRASDSAREVKFPPALL